MSFFDEDDDMFAEELTMSEEELFAIRIDSRVRNAEYAQSDEMSGWGEDRYLGDVMG